jgi:predicted RNA-binding protein YlxR (DUF448 family)
MTRGGHNKVRDDAERRCIVTGETQPKAGLIRFVVGPDDSIVPDLLEKLPGRGIWVTSSRDALQKAAKKGLFARGAKQAVTVPDGLIDAVETGLARRVVDLISLARKAGGAVTGFEKVKSWLMTEHARVLIQASDGSGRGKSKLRPPEGNNSFIGILTANELGLAFGRENVIHGALAAGGLTKRVVEEAARLKGLRRNIGGDATDKKGLRTK